MATELHHSRSKVERSVRELKRRGLLEVISRPGHSNLYRLLLPTAPPKAKKIPTGERITPYRLPHRKAVGRRRTVSGTPSQRLAGRRPSHHWGA